MIDGDGQHDPADVPKLFDHLEEGSYDVVVVGSRFTDEVKSDIPAYRLVGLSVINIMTNLSMGRGRGGWLSDTQSGCRGYSKRAIRSLAGDPTFGDNMSASTDILYHVVDQGFEIGEVGISVEYDVEEASTHHPLRHGLELLNNILRTVEHTHPIATLGIPGVLSTLIGIGFAYWVFDAFLRFNTVPVEPAIASMSFGLAGIFASFTAIILHALNTFHAKGGSVSDQPRSKP